MALSIPIWPKVRLVVTGRVIRVGPERRALRSPLIETIGAPPAKCRHAIMIDIDAGVPPNDFGDDSDFIAAIQMRAEYAGIQEGWIVRTPSGGAHFLSPQLVPFRTLVRQILDMGGDMKQVRFACQFGGTALALYPHRPVTLYSSRFPAFYLGSRPHYELLSKIYGPLPTVKGRERLLEKGAIVGRKYNKNKILWWIGKPPGDTVR